MVRPRTRIMHASLVQTDMEMAEIYANQQCTVSSHWKICRMMCVSINGPGDLDLLTLKLVCESHQKWWTFVPNLGTLGLWFLELFAMYVIDGWTDGEKLSILPLPYGWGHNKQNYLAEQEAFSVVAPRLCNSLPSSVRNAAKQCRFNKKICMLCF